MTQHELGRADGPLHVIATAGHVDHGKSALVLRLTGMDPDRLAEEKRRGLTIDLGFAWCTLPSGREVGFVDVPGHERFVRNMLAGVGPLRLVLFVVAADEGWKPQSEEHLGILDVLGAEGAVVALTKRDLVDDETLDITASDVRDRLAGTVLEKAPIVPCSSVTAEGLDELRETLDATVAAAALPEQDGRPRQFLDRVFTIRGAGTVVTGTLVGGRLAVGQEVEIYPTGARARIRELQTHRRSMQLARPVSRVATNLVGVEREDLERGDILGLPGQWRPTTLFDAALRAIRGLAHPITGRGAYKLYAGAAERDARIRLHGADEVRPGKPVFARIRLSAPLVLDVHERFVLREAGRRATVGGGGVLDPEPSVRAGDPTERLRTREAAGRDELPGLLVRERGAIRGRDLIVLTGLSPSRINGAERVAGWWVAEPLHRRVVQALHSELARYHNQHPLREGADLAEARSAVSAALEAVGRTPDPSLVEALLEDLARRGLLARSGSVVRLPSHTVRLEERQEEVDRLLRTVGESEPMPPSVAELQSAGFSREVVEAAARAGALVRISPDLVMTSGFVARAEELLRARAKGGITVSQFRGHLGTSRKFALPLLEYFDQRGLTKRQGNLRFLRGAATPLDPRSRQ